VRSRPCTSCPWRGSDDCWFGRRAQQGRDYRGIKGVLLTIDLSQNVHSALIKEEHLLGAYGETEIGEEGRETDTDRLVTPSAFSTCHACHCVGVDVRDELVTLNAARGITGAKRVAHSDANGVGQLAIVQQEGLGRPAAFDHGAHVGGHGIEVEPHAGLGKVTDASAGLGVVSGRQDLLLVAPVHEPRKISLKPLLRNILDAKRNSLNHRFGNIKTRRS